MYCFKGWHVNIFHLSNNISMRSLPPLTALRVFETAGKHLSFTEAAKTLHVTQGAVSRQIKQLEDYLGVPLFVRLHHKMELTTAGVELLTKLEQSFDLMEDAIHDIRGDKQRQKLNVCAPPTFATRWLAPLLSDFQQRYPELELSVHNQESEHIIFDCVIRFGLLAKPRLYSKLLMLEQHVAVCAPTLESQASTLSFKHCNFLHILHDGQRLPVWGNWLRAASIDSNENDHRGMEFSTLDQVINAVRTGAGLAIIDKRMITEELREGSLVQFSNVELPGEYGYWLDIVKERQGLSKVQHFCQWLQDIKPG